ncbi:C-C motif chemokine 13-like [Protopterus annectens]|uniref:C-C motif chemokine 13-like n=1 Tax=Protopterus annectens TaxID=7888 RepID=UPI001CF9D28F|nr:C-C motif chemokine 13-like [Protopterus annectens]
MTSSHLAILVLMLSAFCMTVLSASHGLETPSKCCFQFSNAAIPVKKLKGYYNTDEACPTKAVVFVNQAGAEFCRMKDLPWVTNHMKRLPTLSSS